MGSGKCLNTLGLGAGQPDLRVLVVDDDAVSRALLATLVDRAGCEILGACDSQDGLFRTLELRPDLVLIADGVLPAAEVVETVRDLFADCRPHIILVTDLEDENMVTVALDRGADDFILKPLNEKVVMARLQAWQRMVHAQLDDARRLDSLRQQSEELVRHNDRLRQLAITDELTGLPNRRYAMDRIEQAWSAAERLDMPLSCLVVDLDGFKQINDVYGHDRGDEVLRTVAAAIKGVLRTEDTVCRIGGDEFLIICPDVDLDAALACGEQLRREVEALGIQGARRPFGLSVGVAERRSRMGVRELIQLADKGMYRAKYNGRNRVCSVQATEGCGPLCLIAGRSRLAA